MGGVHLGEDCKLTPLFKRAIVSTYLFALAILAYSIYNWYYNGFQVVVLVSIIADILVIIFFTKSLRKFLKVRKELRNS